MIFLSLIFYFICMFEMTTFDLFCYRLIHGGQFLNGLAGPTIMSAGPYLSTTWFAPDQRATATAVASLFSYLGGAASFIVGPLIVPAPNDSQTATVAPPSTAFIQSRIQLVMYAGTGEEQEPHEGTRDRWDIISTLCLRRQGTEIQSGDRASRILHKRQELQL